MKDRAIGILKSVFGFDRFRPSQQEVIDHLISGGDALVLMPTGGGKSLCYQIPSIVRKGTGIIVSPLISLMQNQVSALVQSGVRAAFLNSSLSAAESQRVERQLLAGELDLLYVAPERLMMPSFLALLERITPALFAIDESHCVSQWGHDFRREYLQLSMLHERFPHVPRIALTATADEATRREIIKLLGLGNAKVVVTGFDRPNIQYRVMLKDRPLEQLLRFIRDEHQRDAGIVYCLSRKRVDETAQWLRDKGLNSLPYHAGMTTDARQRTLDTFMKDEGVIVVATIAFGLGIDKPDVRFVAHLDLPKSVEAYYQETGRAGRDGLPSDAWMVYSMQDVVMLRRMIEGSESDDTRKRVERQKLDSLVALCEVSTCRRQAVLGYFGETNSERCDNCDTCLEPVETWDGTIAAQKALSCVSRTGQKFGATYVIDVLLGKDSERIRSLGHHTLSTFGIGGELDATQWHSVIRQLVARNLLDTDHEGYGSLLLNKGSWAVMKGELKLHLRKDIKRDKTRAQRKGRGAFTSASDNALWEALRQRRAELAKEQGVPPFIIFHDSTLMDMVQRRPRDIEQMGLVSGVGKRKLDLYAEDFLKIILEHSAEQTEEPRPPAASDTVALTIELFKKGMNVEAVAAQRNLKPDTIYKHLCQGIKEGAIELRQVVTLSDQEIKTIADMIQKHQAFKPVYEALGGAYDYNTLHCVLASMRK